MMQNQEMSGASGMAVKTKGRRPGGGFFLHLFMVIVAILALFPVLWMVAISIKPVGHSISGFEGLRLTGFTWANYERLFELIPFRENVFNSLFTTVVGTLTTLYFCSLAGYAFAKLEFRGRRVLFILIVASMMITPEVGSIPLFIIMRKMGLINSLWSLILPRMATAIGIFYMRQYIVNLPDELLDAARIDGCTEYGIYRRVVVPVIKPALASWAALTVIARWNDYFWPLLYLRKPEKFTLMVSVSMLPVSDGLSTPWQVVLAGTTVVIVPSILLYLFLQLFQKEGMTAGAVKG